MKKAKKDTVVGYIYETYDYDKFSFLEENRDINPANLEKIKKSMKEKRLLNPISVDLDFNIYDGQHRFTTCEELGYPVHYLVDENLTLSDIPRLNSIARTWTNKEYLSYFCKRGKKDYKIMNKFILDYNLNLSLALALLYFDDSGRCYEIFKNGRFKVKDLGKSKILASYWTKIIKINPSLGKRFAHLLIQLYDNPVFDVDLFIHKIEVNPLKLVQCSTVSQRKKMVQDIYNYRNKNKVNLMF